MRLKSKFTLAAITLAAIPVILSSSISGWITQNETHAAMNERVSAGLVALREEKKTQITDYMQTITNQLANLAQSIDTRNAMRQFSDAFRQMALEQAVGTPARLKDEMADFYRNQFGKRYQTLNPGDSIDSHALIQQVNNLGTTMQHRYIVDNPHPLGEKHKLLSNPKAGPYDSVHQTFHPGFRDFLERFEYYDIFLVEPTQGYVVYSVYKELDYATSLINGPFANSGLADAFNQAKKLPAGQTYLNDFSVYLPSYDGHASFISTPIYDNGRLTGVLIFQMPVDRINSIMTSNQRWQDIGLGKSGETYLVGNDGTLRSRSRFMIEDKQGYIEALRTTKLDSEIITKISAKGSGIGLHHLDTSSVQKALKGESGYQIAPDYRGVPVASAYTQVNILGLKWALLAEIDEEEAFAPLQTLNEHIITAAIITAALIIALATLAGMRFSSVISTPIVSLQNTMSRIEKESDLSLRATVSSNDEIGRMAQIFNDMMNKFQHTIGSVRDSSQQVAAAAEEMSAITQDTQNALDKQNAELDQVATAVNEMSSTIQEVASNTASAASASKQTDSEIRKGRQVVNSTIDAIQTLAGDIEKASEVISNVENESQTIGSVLDVIKGIAEQTNLLALNAAIEAARAGDQGRGFAVVADEVRNLAQRTQESTEEIHSMIARLQNGTGQAVNVMQNSKQRAETSVDHAASLGSSFEEIAKAIDVISDMSTQIASAVEEQSAVADEINRNITNISQASQSTADGARQTADASNDMARLATELRNLASQFK